MWLACVTFRSRNRTKRDLYLLLRVAIALDFQEHSVETGLRTATRIRVLQRATTTLLAGQYEIENKVDSIFCTFIDYRMNAPIIDLIKIPFPHVD